MAIWSPRGKDDLPDAKLIKVLTLGNGSRSQKKQMQKEIEQAEGWAGNYTIMAR
jgi:hypothetical protein